MSLSTPPSTPPHPLSTSQPEIAPPSTTFDIISHCNTLRHSSPSTPLPLVAIESLIALLSSTPLSTISETLALLSSQSHLLLSSQPNPIPLSAGTDLFQRYLITSFQKRGPARDFESLRNHLISQSKLFVSRTKAAPKKIAEHALAFVRDDTTILTYGSSAVIDAVLSHATEAGRYFDVVRVAPSTPSSQRSPTRTTATNNGTTSTGRDVTIPLATLTSTLSSLPPTRLQNTILLLPSTAVLENGAIVGLMGTHQICLLARHFGLPVYVCTESYSFVRRFALGTGSGPLRKLGVSSELLGPDVGVEVAGGVRSGDGDAEDGKAQKPVGDVDMIETTTPGLITALITENGVMSVEDVSEEMVKLWF